MSSSDERQRSNSGCSSSKVTGEGYFLSWQSVQGMGVSYACGQAPSHKDEDCFFVVSSAMDGLCDGLIALFDGHNGVFAAQYAKENLLRALLEHHNSVNVEEHDLEQPEQIWPSSLNASITAAFNKIDTEIKASSSSGTTATLILFRKGPKGELYCKTAWVGDSRAVVFTDRGATDMTADHRLDNQGEINRIAQYYGEGSFCVSPSSQEPLHIGGGLCAKPRPIAVSESEDDICSYSLPIATGLLSEQTEISSQSLPNLQTLVGETDSDSESERRSSDASNAIVDLDIVCCDSQLDIPRSEALTIGQETTPKRDRRISDSFVGVFADRNGRERSSTQRLFHGRTKKSLQCSRSLGDLGAASAVISSPEIRNMTVVSPARLVLCSDGVWDVLDSDECFKQLKGKKSVGQAVEKLLKKTLSRAQYTGQRDDVSAIAVDVGFAQYAETNKKTVTCSIV
ncbi:hypothetical protein CYMTET_49031 [Cymbomonas tetramitiformis]|uniref:PPM-type phosphatase domain-containing protein n=1 Tax=Cymbomonas tetramitiformis TaxID=36881 RepID=A0AAE0EW65_9CHLO|nr:hypothetical protein CYMTET_49031 [Cymbomonas tetramitiformis]